MTEHTPRSDGLHDEFLAQALAGLPPEEWQRFLDWWAVVDAVLAKCPGAATQELLESPNNLPEDPPVRFSRWMRGLPARCTNHKAHTEHVYRSLAKEARDAGDPLWKGWHAVADSGHLAEAMPPDPFKSG
jgi:hypothetical protein